MRYIRFLKTPRTTPVKTPGKHQVSCLITITSDLGDSFFPHDAELVAELIDAQNEEILVWRTVTWAASMRTLAITLPLKKSYAGRILRVRIGTEQEGKYDMFENLCDRDSQGIVSAWSADFDLKGKEAERLVERRFKVGQRVISVWEETGESIARHLWDAGITLSCHMLDLQSQETSLCKALNLTAHASGSSTRLNILELGTGCGIVGITLASVLPNCNVKLSDLPEAREIVEKNITGPVLGPLPGSSLSFLELDWDNELPAPFSHAGAKFDLVLAVDCTYNSDSSPALVHTLRRLADFHPKIVVGIAMKMRHDSERVFFDLMAETGFRETDLLEYPLPGDVEAGEDSVYLHVYRYRS